MTTKNKKKKTAREKRILVGAFLTAVVIAAGSTFAWFTSSDEVTNRLSASADYEVKIVESFAPPENWIPGQDVDKDVYAVNTGNIAAYAKATVSGAMSITREVPFSIDGLTKTTATSATSTTYTNLSDDSTSDSMPANYTPLNEETQLPLYDAGGMSAADSAGVAVLYARVPNGATGYVQSGAGIYNDTVTPPNNSPYTYIFYTENPGTPGTAASIDGNKDLVTLDKDERYAVEAGAYLAFKPDGDTVNKVGEQVVAYNEKNDEGTYKLDTYRNNTTGEIITAEEYNALTDEDKATKYTKIDGENFTNGTDFEPHADGLYIFRRSIVVKTSNDIDAGTEEFAYDGYYFYGGVYYKIMNLAVTPDTVTDLGGDGVKTDGNLSAADASLVKESKEYIENVPLTYDGANHRLVATLANSDMTDYNANLTSKAQAIDAAEHELAAAELALREAMNNAGIRDANVDAAQAEYDAKVAAYNAAKAAYDRAKAAYDAAKAEYDAALDAFNNAKNAVNADLNSSGAGLVGNNDGTVALAHVDTAPAKIDNGESSFSSDTTTLTLKDAGGSTIATITGVADNSSLADAYADAWTAWNTFATTYGTNDAHHVYATYLKELNDATNSYTSSITDFEAATDAELKAEIENVLNSLTYSELSSFTPTTDLHNYHTLVANLKLAKDNLDSALAQYQADVATFNTTIDGLGLPETDKIADGESADVSSTDIDPLGGTKFAALQTAREALDGTLGTTYAEVTAATEGTGGAKGDLTAAETAMNTALENLNNARTTLEGNTNVDGNLKAAQAKYNEALAKLNAAKANYDVADSSYANSGDIVIYINLNNDVLSGGTANKWQILPTVVADNQAVFYYTSILGAGDVSEQLIDSVTLADTVTQYMYKYFDFDLNVKLDSAQITYDDNNKSNVTVAAANEAFDWTESNNAKHDVTGALSPANVADGVVTWSETVG